MPNEGRGSENVAQGPALEQEKVAACNFGRPGRHRHSGKRQDSIGKLAARRALAARDAGGEGRDGIGGRGQVSLAGEARSAAGTQIMVAVGRPMQRDGRRQRHGFDLVAGPEGIALALDDEGRAGQRLEVGRAQVFRLVGRMEGVAEADEAGSLLRGEGLIGDEARDASAHRLAADQQRRSARPGLGENRPELGNERLGFRRRALFSAVASARHVGELEAQRLDVPLLQELGEGFKERAVHGPSGAVRAEESRDRRRGRGDQEGGWPGGRHGFT